MLARIYDKWFVPMALALFALHFMVGTMCGFHPNFHVNDQFNEYLKPGFLLLTGPFPHAWFQGTLLGCYLYVGTMLFYSAVMAAAGVALLAAVRFFRCVRMGPI